MSEDTGVPKSGLISERLIRNTSYNAVGRFWNLLVVLALTPYIIGHIGVERYGIWAAIGVLTGYFGLLDFGIGTSFVKYIADFHAKANVRNINRLVVTGFTFYLLFAIALFAAARFFAGPLLAFIKVPSHLHGEALSVFLIGIAVFGASNALSVFSAIQTGLQRMDISNIVAIAISICSIMGTIFVLESGYGLIGLMYNNAAMLGLAGIINIIVAFRILPSLKVALRFFDLDTLRRLFDFGYKVQITRLEGIFTFQTDKIIIAHFLNVGLVSFYQLGSTVVMQARELPLLLITALVPAVAELDARKDKERLYELYLRGTKYVALVGLPVLTYVFVNAHLIMFAWMGFGYERSALVIRVFAPCYMINILTGVGTSLAFGMGRPDMQAKLGAAQLLLNLALSIALVLKMGFIGVVVATLISLSLSSICFIFMLHGYLRYDVMPFLKKVVAVPLVSCLLAGITIFLCNAFINMQMSRPASLTLLIAEGAAFMAVYCVLVAKGRYLDRRDREILAAYIGKVMAYIKAPQGAIAK
jgi:O-antigen/teichoic acid export membrane protein